MLGWVALAAVVAVSFVRKEHIGMVWLAALGYAVACQIPIYLMRSSRFTALELAQTLRYLPDLVVVLALLAAVGLCAPNRARSRWLDASRVRTAVIVSLTVAFVASSLYSTATFLTSWRDNPTQPYLQNARTGLAAAHASSDAPLLDQEVDPLVLQRVAWPENLASHMFALLRDRPEFAGATTRTAHARFQLGVLSTRRSRGCGRSLKARRRNADTSSSPTSEYGCRSTVHCCLPIGLPRSTTSPTVDGSMTLSLSEGTETKVPVRPGLNRVFVRLPGAGDAISVAANTSALSVCIAAGPVGFLAPT